MRFKIKILGLVVPLVFILDQLTKKWIVSSIDLGGSIPIIPGIFDLVHARNPGAAFGFMAHLPASIRAPLFLILSTVTLSFLMVYFFRLQQAPRAVYFCLALILGGALGNIYDRLTMGEVVDFLSFHWYDEAVHFGLGSYRVRFALEWPAFNVADAAISVAVFWLAILMLGKKNRD